MNTKTATIFCVKLYCDLPSLLQGLFEPDFSLYMKCRYQVHELVKSIGRGVQYLGGSGTTTTWGFLNKARLAALQWMSALFGVKMCANGPN
jgi:hypothetical protein